MSTRGTLHWWLDGNIHIYHEGKDNLVWIEVFGHAFPIYPSRGWFKWEFVTLLRKFGIKAKYPNEKYGDLTMKYEIHK